MLIDEIAMCIIFWLIIFIFLFIHLFIFSH